MTVRFYFSDCVFEAVEADVCPSDPNLSECNSNMSDGDLCEADHPLPDGNQNYDINNCGRYDVFTCAKGDITKSILTIICYFTSIYELSGRKHTSIKTAFLFQDASKTVD